MLTQTVNSRYNLAKYYYLSFVFHFIDIYSILVKWWAQYMESQGDMESAMKHYTNAEDNLSMVRVMCFLEDYDRAADIANW